MNPEQLPPYISGRGHGEISYAVPLQIRDVTCYSFVLRADRGPLQRFVDAQLNAVSAGAVTYTALPFLFHSYLEAKHCTSTAETVGYLPDRESAFLLPLLQRSHGHPLPSLKIWVPYLLIDQMAGMVTGREVWGYWKSLGSIALPQSPTDPAGFSAQTMLFREFSPATCGEWATLLQVRGHAPKGELQSIWTDLEGAFRHIVERALGAIESAPDGLTAEAIHGLFGAGRMPVVNLKQFRDAADSTRACYQALVESPCRLDRWGGGGLLSGDFEVEIATCDSHQIVTDLGLGPLGSGGSTVVRPLFGCWMKMDFSTLAGSVVWQAS